MKKLIISLYILIILPILFFTILLILDFGIVLSITSTFPLYLFIIPYTITKFRELNELRKVGVEVKAKVLEIVGCFKGIYQAKVSFNLNEKDETTFVYLDHNPLGNSYLILIHPKDFKKYIIIELI